MSVRVALIGRLGNNLFQYAVGRILAEHHGLALDCERDYAFGYYFIGQEIAHGSVATLEGLTEWFPNAPLHTPGRRVTAPLHSIELGPESAWRGQVMDLASMLADGRPRHIRLAGYFQRFEYLAPHRSRVRAWLQPRPVGAQLTPGPRDVIVNLRRDFDFGILDWTLPVAYYERVLANLGDLGQVYVCGTSIDAGVRRAFAKYQPVYLEGEPIEQFIAMTRFNRIVLSNSTFAWWAAFLSDATEVYAPRSADGVIFGFTGWQDVDLHMREPRYVEVLTNGKAPFAPFTVTEAARRRTGRSAAAAANEAEDTGLDTPSVTLLEWMMAEDRPLSWSEVCQQCDGHDASPVLRPLLDAGLVSLATRYLEPV